MSEQFDKLISNVNTNLKKAVESIKNLNERVKNKEFQFEDGNSFLTLKNTLMLEYLSNLSYLSLIKQKGKKIENQKCVQRLAELRCVFDKVKPIEAKLKYQIDKALKLAENPNRDENNPLNFRPNTDNFDDKESGEDADSDENADSDDEDEVKTKKDGIYRPPKMAPVQCDIDETVQDRMNKRIEKVKKLALNSSLMKDLQKQYSEAPEEVINNIANTMDFEDKEAKHRQEYEEDNFIRKPLTKKEMVKMKRQHTGSNLHSLTSFDDARVLLDENIDMEDYVQSKKKKKTKNGKTGGSKSKKSKKKRIRYT